MTTQPSTSIEREREVRMCKETCEKVRSETSSLIAPYALHDNALKLSAKITADARRDR